jgi:VanZ family protein
VTRRLFRLAFALQLGLDFLIGLGAYTGKLPTSLPQVPHIDLLIHAILIGLLGGLLDGSLGFRRVVPRLAFPGVGAVLVLVVAGIEEYAQRFSPRRSSTYSDFFADVVGVLFFSWLARRLSSAAVDEGVTPRVRT